jgi:hypothetical protein
MGLSTRTREKNKNNKYNGKSLKRKNIFANRAQNESSRLARFKYSFIFIFVFSSFSHLILKQSKPLQQLKREKKRKEEKKEKQNKKRRNETKQSRPR